MSAHNSDLQVAPTPSMLKGVKLLQTLNDEELKKLIAVGVAKDYEGHTNVVIEGELSWGIYLILRGRVGVFKTNQLTGDSYDVGQLSTGSFFGEMSLVDENPRSATVRTLSNSSLFYISKDKFLQFLATSTDLTLRFYLSTIKHLVNRLRDLDENYVVSQYQLWKTMLQKEEKPR